MAQPRIEELVEEIDDLLVGNTAAYRRVLAAALSDITTLLTIIEESGGEAMIAATWSWLGQSRTRKFMPQHERPCGHA